MGIKQKIQAAKAKQGDSDLELKNHQEPCTLIDPEDAEPGSTYSVKASAFPNAADGEIPDDEDDLNDDSEASDDADADADDLDDDGEVDAAPADTATDDSASGIDWDAPAADDEFVEDVEASADDENTDDDGSDSDFETSTGDMTLLDADEVDDSDVDNIMFASFGTNLMVLKANRVIATMNSRTASATNKRDVYLSDQFQEVVASEMNKVGVRAGLRSMGFDLAKVKVSNTAVTAMVKQEVTRTTAAVRASSQSKDKAFTQSLAIASVGINRNFFKGTKNELRAALIQELNAAGVRGAERMVSRVFATHGQAYAHSLVTLATKLAAMPDESRNGYVDALEMTNEDVEPAFEDENAVNTQLAGDDSEDDEFMEDAEPVVASLSSPGVDRSRVTASRVHNAQATGYSVAASAILNGDKPLTF